MKPEEINVLIACEESQAECKAFRDLGFNAYSCDVQPCRRDGRKEWHILGDVSPYLMGECVFTTMDGVEHVVPGWNLIIAHPPCTYLCKVGSPHLYKEPDTYIEFRGEQKFINMHRYTQMMQGREFFLRCLNAHVPYLAVENPIPMAMARLPKPSCFADPSWYGVKYTKKTLYWTKNLPPLMAGARYPDAKEFVRASRGKYRSRTFPQLAQAVAEQWGGYVLDELTKQEER